MSETIYVITHYQNNHIRRDVPIDSRFLSRDKNYIFYLVDDAVAKQLATYPYIFEKDIDPVFHRAGKYALAEWSFLLAEAKHSFCSYPFFMISSRFYEKNRLLQLSLSQLWDKLFSFFENYEWGWLPSYDRYLHWVDISWKRFEKLRNEGRIFAPIRRKSVDLVDQLLGLENYHTAPFCFCNYIGFKNREALLSYVNFYKPLIEFFYDENFEPKEQLSEYVDKAGIYYQEKTFTFLLECYSHLFFYKANKPFFHLHYDGFYDINLRDKQMKKLSNLDLPYHSQAYIKLKKTWNMLDQVWWTGPYVQPLRSIVQKAKAIKSKLSKV